MCVGSSGPTARQAKLDGPDPEAGRVDRQFRAIERWLNGTPAVTRPVKSASARQNSWHGGPDAMQEQALAGPGVIVTGAVDDVRPWLAHADLVVAPLRVARGIQNKVLEAMSMGLPVVATPCAAQGLGEVDRDTLIEVDGAQALGDAVLALLADQGRREAVGARAAAFVRERFRWENMFERIDAVFAAAMAAHHPDRVTAG